MCVCASLMRDGHGMWEWPPGWWTRASVAADGWMETRCGGGPGRRCARAGARSRTSEIATKYVRIRMCMPCGAPMRSTRTEQSRAAPLVCCACRCLLGGGVVHSGRFICLHILCMVVVRRTGPTDKDREGMMCFLR